MEKGVKFEKSKKGMEMAFSTLVGMILAIILLALIIVFFTGGFNGFKEKIGSFFSDSNVDITVDNCNRLVSIGSSFDYCCVNKTIKISSKVKYDMPCTSASNYSWGARIDKLDCSGVC
jgi:hypothetical protein